MTANRDEQLHRFLEEEFPGYDQSYVPVIGGSWSDYSGCAWMVLLERNGQLYELSYCSGPYSDDSGADWNDITPVTEQQAFDLLLEWEENLD